MDDLEKLYKAQESGINVSVWVEIDGVDEEFREKLTKTNNERRKNFHFKEVELIKERKYIRTELLDKPRLNIEYFGKFV